MREKKGEGGETIRKHDMTLKEKREQKRRGGGRREERGEGMERRGGREMILVDVAGQRSGNAGEHPAAMMTSYCIVSMR